MASTFSIFQDEKVAHSPMPSRTRKGRPSDKENVRDGDGNGNTTLMRKRKSMKSMRVSFAPKHSVRIFEDYKSPQAPEADSPPAKHMKRSPPPLRAPPGPVFPDDDDSMMQLTDTFTSQQVADMKLQETEEQTVDELTMELTDAGGSLLAESSASIGADAEAVPQAPAISTLEADDETVGAMELAAGQIFGGSGLARTPQGQRMAPRVEFDAGKMTVGELDVGGAAGSGPLHPVAEITRAKTDVGLVVEADPKIEARDVSALENQDEDEDEEYDDVEMDFTHAAGAIVLPETSQSGQSGQSQSSQDTTQPPTGADSGLEDSVYEDRTRFSSFAGSEFTENDNLTLGDFTRFSMASVGSLSQSQAPEMTDKMTRALMAKMARKNEKRAVGIEERTIHGILINQDRDLVEAEADVEADADAEVEEDNDSLDVVFRRALALGAGADAATSKNLNFAEFSRLAGIRFLTNLTAAVKVTDLASAMATGTVTTETMGDGEAVEETCVVLPRFENLQWGVNQLLHLTQSLSQTVDGLEAQMSRHNPAIYRAIANASSDDLIPLQQHTKKLQTMENLRAHLLWYEWKLKLERNVNKTVLASFDQLTSDASTIQLYESSLKELTNDVKLASLKLRFSRDLDSTQKELSALSATPEAEVGVSQEQIEDLEDEFTVLEGLQSWRVKESGSGSMQIAFPGTNITIGVSMNALGVIESLKPSVGEIRNNPLLDTCVSTAVRSVPDLLPSDADLAAMEPAPTIDELSDLVLGAKIALGRSIDLYTALLDLRSARREVKPAIGDAGEPCVDIVCVNREQGSKWVVRMRDVGPATSMGANGKVELHEVYGGIDLESMQASLDCVPGGYGWIDRVGEVLDGWC